MPWSQETPKGREITSYDHELNHAELIEWDCLIDANEDVEDPFDDPFDDPDADGNGWERKALRGVW